MKNNKVVLILLALFATDSLAAPVELKSRIVAQTQVALEQDIIDGVWGIVGNKPNQGAHVYRNPKGGPNGEPSYLFHAKSNKVNRIEFTEAFGRFDTLDKLSAERLEKVLAIKDAYLNVDVGHYGDTVTYSWSTKFPQNLDKNSQGIVAQWHGRPDRTLIEKDGLIQYLSIDEFYTLQQQYQFRKDKKAINRRTNKVENILIDGAAGGPIAALRLGDGYLHMIVRSENARRSDSLTKVKPKATSPLGKTISKGSKQGALVWKLPVSQITKDKWMNFKVEIHYSEYSLAEDEVLTPGHIKIWLDGKMVADWQGNIGKNDILGPYFKFGIYKPGRNGIMVEHSNYQRQIARTRKSPVQHLH
ncbi:heparin lyase I family protein [Paraferrimonas sp. SM1919]|uniref:heparin lyase I family protein n=1 Tax=Paraferrimonas sp. SM1919 TaxID=2662263 RepID=UPI0013D85A97|nr:heparin lyase I family protein [Paraferrimonas sp. SM1919]